MYLRPQFQQKSSGHRFRRFSKLSASNSHFKFLRLDVQTESVDPLAFIWINRANIRVFIDQEIINQGISRVGLCLKKLYHPTSHHVWCELLGRSTTQTLTSLAGTSYLPTPAKLEGMRKCLLNIKNSFDNFRFIYSIVAYLFPRSKNGERPSQYHDKFHRLIFSESLMPLKGRHIARFESDNNLFITLHK